MSDYEYHYNDLTFYGEDNGCDLEKITSALNQSFGEIDRKNGVENKDDRYFINPQTAKKRFYIHVFSLDDALALTGVKIEEGSRVPFDFTPTGFVFLEGNDEQNWKRKVKVGEFVIMLARVSQVFDGLLENVLRVTFTGPIPPLEAMRAIVSRYASPGKAVGIKTITSGGYEVTFDANTKDGAFARLMLHGCPLKGGMTTVNASYSRAPGARGKSH